MATYIQGVTDYIPQYQPFEPDYNFYSNIMQTKQSQYDSNWKALNSMYSEYYNADLTRESNIKKRDSYLKDIEFNLKRVSQLDLSLEQNVNQASQIFKPFYEDTGLMSDMVKTKKAKSQISLGESYQKANDPLVNKKYWNVGIEKIKFELDDFKNASDEDASSMEISNYTPQRDITAEVNKITKDFGNVQFAPEFKNGFIITTTNGEKLTEPLYKLYESSLGDDPGIQDMFKAEAYVDRKRYALQNAAQFGGDKNKAEMKYLEDHFNILKDKMVAEHSSLEEKNTTYDTKLLDLEQQKKDKKGGPDIDKEIAQYKLNKEINTKVLNRAKQSLDIFNENDGSTDFKNPYGDLKSLRWKVDNGMASTLMQKKFLELANIFSMKNMKTDYKTNQYEVMKVKNQYDRGLVAQRNAATLQSANTRANATMYAAQLKVAADKQRDYDKYMVDTKQGRYMDDGEGNKVVVPYTEQQGVYEDPTFSTKSGAFTGEGSQYIKNKKAFSEAISSDAGPLNALKSMTAVLNDLVRSKKMSQAKATEILSYSNNKKVSLKSFNDQLSKTENLSWYLTNRIGEKDLKGIINKFTNYIEDNPKLSNFKNDNVHYDAFVKDQINISDYFTLADNNKKWKIEAASKIEKKIYDETKSPNAKYLFDENGNKRTKEQYFNALADAGAYSFDARGTGRRILDVIPFVGNADDQDKGEYEIFSNKANYFYSNSAFMKNIKGPLPGSGTGAGISSVSSIDINPNSPTGQAHFGQAIADLNKFDYGSNNKDRVSFLGYSANAYDKAGPNGKFNRNDKGLEILDKLRRDMNNPKSGLGIVKLSVLPIAGNKSDIGAYIFKPDITWLNANTEVRDKSTGAITKAGLLTANQAALATKNGITYMMENNKMQSDIYKHYFMDPLASNIINGKPYRYVDPTNKDFNFTINSSLAGPSDFTITGTFPVWNPETKQTDIKEFQESSTVYGSELSNFRNQLITELFPNIKENLIVDYNNLDQYGIKYK